MGAGDTLTGGVSTPSSEALDKVTDLRHSRTLPNRGGISNNNPASNGVKVTWFFYLLHFYNIFEFYNFIIWNILSFSS